MLLLCVQCKPAADADALPQLAPWMSEQLLLLHIRTLTSASHFAHAMCAGQASGRI
jgi:hypothetical protein